MVPLTILIVMPAFGQMRTTPDLARQRECKLRNPPRTVDGQPDIRGGWSSTDLTPLEHAAEFADKAFLTDQEAAVYAKRIREGRNMDRRDGGGEADVARALQRSVLGLWKPGQ